MKTPDLRPSILHARSIGLFFAFGLACLAQAKVVSVCAAGPPTCDAATIALGLTQAAAADVIELRSDITEAVNLTRTVSEIRADGVRNRYWTSGGATSTLEISNAMPGAVAVRNVVMNHVSGTGHTIGWNPGGTGSLLLQDCDFSISSSADCVYVGTGSLTGNWDMLVVRNCNFDGSGATGAMAVGLYIHNANFLNAISVYNSLFRNWNNPSAALVNRNSTSVQTMRVYNCLFDGNGGAAGSGMQVWSPGEYKNNVFTGNHQDVTIASNGNLAHLSYCAFGTLSAGYGPNCLSGVVRAQCYVNAGTDFHIKAGSATIDTGTTLTHTAQDKDGITRPIGAAYDIGPYEGVAVTPSPSPTPSFSPTISNTWTASSTPTDSPVPSATPTWSLTHTLTDSPTPSATRTWSLTYTLTNSPSPSASPTWTLSHTLTKSPTPSITETWTPTLTRTTSPTPSITETWTPSDTLTDSPTPSVTLTWSLTYTLTSSPTPSVTKTETMTASPTRTPTPTATESASPTGTPSATLSRTPTLTSTPTPTNSPSLTATVTAPGTYTASPTATQSPTPLPTPLGDRLLVAPNPVLGDDSFVLIDWRPGVPMDVVIFGLDGGRVRDLGLRTPPLQWDLRSASGAMTGPGIYIVSVRVPGERRPRFARLARVR